MSKLLFLGSGSAFTLGTDNFQSNMMLINNNGEKLLIDCGSDIRFPLYKAGLSYQDVKDIYISHLHADHVGGLEYIGFNHKFNPKCNKPHLYVNEAIAKEIWTNTLSGGMGYTEGKSTNLDSFFVLHSIGDEQHFYWQGIKFNLLRVIHVNSGPTIMPSYGLFFEVDGVKVLLTTDTQFRLDIFQEKYEEADIIFHDCEISAIPTPVHPHYTSLVNLPAHIKQKIWLYGYQPEKLPEAEKDGFLGFVKRGHIFDFEDIYLKGKN